MPARESPAVPGPGQSKEQLRRRLRAARTAGRAAATQPEWEQRGIALAAAVLADPQVAAASARGGVIATYLSYGAEPPTWELARTLRGSGATVLAPVIEPGHQLGWADACGPTAIDVRGVPRPAGPVLARGAAGLLGLGCEVVIIPALAVAPGGVRLGQGVGYYDRLLAGLPRFQDSDPGSAGPLRLAIVGPGEVLDTLPAEPHDATVDRWIVA